MKPNIRLNLNNTPLPAVFGGLASLLLLLTGTGCRMFEEFDDKEPISASVTIRNRAQEEIALATGKAFTAEGYQGRIPGPGEMIFEKEAPRTTSPGESLSAGYYGAHTIERLRVTLVPAGAGAYKLQCRAFTVSGGSDPFFQDEVPLTKSRRRPHQKILDRVADELKWN